MCSLDPPSADALSDFRAKNPLRIPTTNNGRTQLEASRARPTTTTADFSAKRIESIVAHEHPSRPSPTGCFASLDRTSRAPQPTSRFWRKNCRGNHPHPFLSISVEPVRLSPAWLTYLPLSDPRRSPCMCVAHESLRIRMAGLCYDTQHVEAMTFPVAMPDKTPCALSEDFYQENFRVNPL